MVIRGCFNTLIRGCEVFLVLGSKGEVHVSVWVSVKCWSSERVKFRSKKARKRSRRKSGAGTVNKTKQITFDYKYNGASCAGLLSVTTSVGLGLLDINSLHCMILQTLICHCSRYLNSIKLIHFLWAGIALSIDIKHFFDFSWEIKAFYDFYLISWKHHAWNFNYAVQFRD